MPSSDDADKKKPSKVPLARQSTDEYPPPEAGDTTSVSDPGASAPEDSDHAPPQEATAELSQEQLDALPALQSRDSEPGARSPRNAPASATGDAWGSFEENNAWMSNSQTGRRMRPEPPGGVKDMPPPDAFSDAFPDASGDAPGADDGAGERAVPARLVSVQADTGKRREFVLRRSNVRLGRGSANQIIVDNPSVSREHARFTYRRGMWTVHDLQSGNGVFVNQQRITSARALQHGDEIMFGQTLWQFSVESVGVPPMPAGAGFSTADVDPMPVAAKSKTSRVLTYGLLVGVAVLVVALLVPQVRGKVHKKEADPDATAFAAFKEGIAAFKAHKWDVAERDFGRVALFNPQDPVVQRYQKAIDRERAAEQQLLQAREAQRKGDLVAAHQLTSGVLDSTFRHEAQNFLTTLQTEMDGRVSQAKTALDGGKLAVARELLTAVEEAQPGRPDVAIMQVRLALRTTGAKQSVHLAALGKTRQMPPLSGPTAVAVRYFIDGDVAKALQLFESLGSEEAATVRQAVQRFSDAYEAGLTEYRNKRASQAIRFFNQAKAEEARISHGQCKLLTEIDHKLADMYYIQGVQQFTANTLPAAYQSLHTATTLVPSHTLASRKLAELDQKAADILAGKPGRAQLQMVLQIVPVSSEMYRKAKSRLDALP